MAMSITPAGADDVVELADVAAATFPLACPSSVSAEDVAAFVADHLSEQRFAEYLADPNRAIFIARSEGRIIGYSMLIRGADQDAGIELSKMYVLPDHHSHGAAAALMRVAVDWAAGAGADSVWLGVNQKNARAQRFYRKHGFEIVGTRTFQLGGRTEDDYVMARRV